jgi:hypothetical protein
VAGLLALTVCAVGAAPAPWASADDYTYVRTESGNTRCSVGNSSVVCAGQNPDAPLPVGAPYHDSVVVDDVGNLTYTSVAIVSVGDDIVLRYNQTYHLQGWTILPTDHGTRFTNDHTGHGMFVSIHNVYAF